MTDDNTEDQRAAHRLPPYTFPGRCGACGKIGEIRVHFCRACALVEAGDHFHRLCECGDERTERCS